MCFISALEVMQFARDAHLANEWMAKNDPVVTGKDTGVSET